jgi:Flp pilus assembly pilin Flp
MELIKRFIGNEQGLETVEYAILLGFIVAGTLALISTLGTWVHGEFNAAVGNIVK